MNTVIFLIALFVTAISLVTIVVLAILFLLESANRGWHAVKLPAGQMVFVVAGETPLKLLLNVNGYHARKIEATGKVSGWKVEPTTDPTTLPKEHWLSSYLKRKWGIFWVSWFWPLRQKYSFKIDKVRLATESERASKSPEDWLVIEKNQNVEALRWAIPCAFVAIDTELKNNVKVSIAVTAIFLVDDPYKVVFILRGKFFERLNEVVLSEVTSFFKDKTLEEFTAYPRSPGDLKSLEKEIDSTIIESVGLRCQEGTLGIVGFAVNSGDEDVLDAEKALQIETKKAEANKARADGLAALEAKPFEAILKVIKKAADGNDELAGKYALAKAIGDHQAPLSLGGVQGHSILVDSKPQNQTGTTPP